MLCWLCIVQSLWAYTPGIRAGAECGAAALTPLGATPPNPIFKKYIGLSTGRAARLLSLSVVEKSDSRECHCDTVLVAGVDNIIVTDGAAGLCYVFYTASVRSFNVVTEWEECI